MSQKNRLVSNREIKRVVKTMEELGIPIGAVDIREDGVTVFPPTHTLDRTKPVDDFAKYFPEAA